MKSIKRAIILCWIMLIVCFIIKLFGGNWFEIICNDEHFIRICDYIDKNIILQDCIALILYVISTYFLILAVCQLPKIKRNQNIVLIIFLIVAFFSQYIWVYLKSILEFSGFCIFPIIFRLDRENLRTKCIISKVWYYGIIGSILSILFQAISMFVRNIEVSVLNESVLVSLILLIDYYIMIVLYYLYIKLKKEKENNG